MKRMSLLLLAFIPLFITSSSAQNNDEAIKADLLFGRAERYFVSRDYDSVIATARKILAVSPENVRVLNMMGAAFFKMRNIDKAKRCFEKAIKVDSENPVSYRNMTAIFQKEGDLKRAIDNYKTYISLEKDKSREMYNNLIGLYEEVGNYHEIVNVITSLDYKHDKVLLKKLIYSYIKTGQFESARANLNYYIDQWSDDAYGYFNLSVVYQIKGDYASAVKHIIKAVNMNNGHPENQMKLGEIYLTFGKYNLAVEVFNNILQSANDDRIRTDALWHLADTNYHLGRISEAIAKYKKLKDLYPETEKSIFASYIMENLETKRGKGKKKILDVKHGYQHKYGQCVPASLSMVLKYFGKEVSQDEIAEEIVIHNSSSLARAWLFLRSRGYLSYILTDLKTETLEFVKENIDSGFPVLYSIKNHSGVIAGYDENRGTFITLDPEKYASGESGRDELMINRLLNTPGLIMLPVYPRRTGIPPYENVNIKSIPSFITLFFMLDKETRKICENILARNPETQEALYLLTEYYYSKHNYRKAIESANNYLSQKNIEEIDRREIESLLDKSLNRTHLGSDLNN